MPEDREPDLAILRALDRPIEAPEFVAAHMQGVAERARAEETRQEKKSMEFAPTVSEKDEDGHDDDSEPRQVAHGVQRAPTSAAEAPTEDAGGELDPDRSHVEEMMERLRTDQPPPRIEM